MKKLIVISDWVDDSLTCQEFRSAVENFIDSDTLPHISFVASTPSTIHTAYLLNQIAEIEERFKNPHNTVIFVNTDPRIHTYQRVEEAEGSEFVILHLKSGLIVCGPNALYCFSLIKERVKKVYLDKNLRRGSQFRSRDLFSEVCARLMKDVNSKLNVEKVSNDIIKDLKGHFVGHIDNFGNIKTTITLGEARKKYKYADLLKVKVNGTSMNVRFVDNMFGAKPGELVIYPGSSGKIGDPFLEISAWTHFIEPEPKTGIYFFENIMPGQEIKISGTRKE